MCCLLPERVRRGRAAHGDEARWIDTATVAGYRRVVMCQEARDEAEAALAPGADPAPLLLSMCDRRLMPTPWLNKVPRAAPAPLGRLSETPGGDRPRPCACTPPSRHCLPLAGRRSLLACSL